MQVDDFFTNLSLEMKSLKNRVRNLIDDRHWQTDGEWKESVLRQTLRRTLPRTVEVGRGFVVTGRTASHQIDVLVFDATKPVLFRDGDLAFITPDAVLGLIEVKTCLDPRGFRAAIEKLCSDIELVRDHPAPRTFAGIFAYDIDSGSPQAFLNELQQVATTPRRRLDFAALGCSLFFKYWQCDPADQKRPYEHWHGYDLPERAAGYFVHNVVDAINPRSVFENNDAWFPSSGKEQSVVAKLRCQWADGNPR